MHSEVGIDVSPNRIGKTAMRHEVKIFGRHTNYGGRLIREVDRLANDRRIGVVLAFPEVVPKDDH